MPPKDFFNLRLQECLSRTFFEVHHSPPPMITSPSLQSRSAAARAAAARIQLYRVYGNCFGFEVRCRRRRVCFEGRPSEILPALRLARFAARTMTAGRLLAYARELLPAWELWVARR